MVRASTPNGFGHTEFYYRSHFRFFVLVPTSVWTLNKIKGCCRLEIPSHFHGDCQLNFIVLLTILAIIIQSYGKIIFEIVFYFLSNESSMLSVTKIRHSLSLCYTLQNSIKRVQESINIKVYMPSWGETYPHVSHFNFLTAYI